MFHSKKSKLCNRIFAQHISIRLIILISASMIMLTQGTYPFAQVPPATSDSLAHFQGDSLMTIKVHAFRSADNRSRIQIVDTLNAWQLESRHGGTLGHILSAIPGVSMVQTGQHITKPMIGGLYGDRIAIVQQGTKLAGQSWGGEHGIELDPNIAGSFAVIKGAAGLRYGTGAMGGVVIVNPPPLPFGDSGISGQVNLDGASNGRGGNGSVLLEGSTGIGSPFAWQLQASYKQLGNGRSRHYFLENSGMRSGNLSAALGYRKGRLNVSSYYSHFSTKEGIFLGSVIGSMADLLARLDAKGPFDPGSFAYSIEAPYQTVLHDLANLKLNYHLGQNQKLELSYHYQVDHRQEYAKRRSTRATVPVTDLRLKTQDLQGIWAAHFNNGWFVESGLALNAQQNYNDTITLSNPVVPNFSQNAAGVFARARWQPAKVSWELGLRYDYLSFDAASRRYLYRYYNKEGEIVPNYEVPDYPEPLTAKGGYVFFGGHRNFQHLSFIAGASWHSAHQWHFQSNLGLAWRPPNANELFSYGLHQSVSAIEYGDSTLKGEKGWKWISAVQHHDDRFDFEADLYFHYLTDYTYLMPTGRLESTNTGHYPVFNYQQTDAGFMGLDILFNYHFGGVQKPFVYGFKGAWVRAEDLTNKKFLPMIPSDRYTQYFNWQFHPKGRRNSTWFTGIQYALTTHQKRYESASDFAPPPAGYGLWEWQVGTSWTLKKRRDVVQKEKEPSTMSVRLVVDNLFNKSYRNYLNRFRYYGDELGRNVQLHLSYQF